MQVLGERMKSLLNQKLQLVIFTHFSKLFISLLLKVSLSAKLTH